MKEKRWEDKTNILLGSWLLLTPFLGVGGISDVAAINSYLVGSAIAIFALAALARPMMWEEYFNMSLGIWLIAAPFVLGFSHQIGPTLNQVIVGIVISTIAFSATMPKKMLGGGHGHGHV